VTKRADLELIRWEGEHIVGMGMTMAQDRCYGAWIDMAD
jgi:hypothetical protein